MASPNDLINHNAVAKTVDQAKNPKFQKSAQNFARQSLPAPLTTMGIAMGKIAKMEIHVFS